MGRKPAEEVKIYAHLAVRIDPAMREDAKRYAGEAGISLNQYVSDALAEHNQRQAKKAAKRDQLELVGS